MSPPNVPTVNFSQRQVPKKPPTSTEVFNLGSLCLLFVLVLLVLLCMRVLNFMLSILIKTIVGKSEMGWFPDTQRPPWPTKAQLQKLRDRNQKSIFSLMSFSLSEYQRDAILWIAHPLQNPRVPDVLSTHALGWRFPKREARWTGCVGRRTRKKLTESAWLHILPG